MTDFSTTGPDFVIGSRGLVVSTRLDWLFRHHYHLLSTDSGTAMPCKDSIGERDLGEKERKICRN
nr:MAG TPA: hypothetical protein [Caudoviricetes sp.]